jgi:hypothetical protein
MIEQARRGGQPLFSVCIPQHNRTTFLIEVLRSLERQTCRDFEVCLSDDCSTDGREEELLDCLRHAAFPFVYQRQPKNLRYDGNLRAAIALAHGRYCFLLGNDDALTDAEALARLAADLQRYGPAGVVISDFEDWSSGQRAYRVRQTANYGAGPRVAAGHFRNFSFVSGILLQTEPAQALATEKWDGSEMYQTYVGCRLIAAGLPLLERDDSVIRKDIHVEGEQVDCYAHRPRERAGPIVERSLPLGQLGRLVIDAIGPHTPPEQRPAFAEHVLLQLTLFTFPYWILEYRRTQSLRYAAGVALGLRPRRVAAGVALGPWRRLRLHAAFAVTALAGLLVPPPLFRALQSRLYRLAKRYR